MGLCYGQSEREDVPPSLRPRLLRSSLIPRPPYAPILVYQSDFIVAISSVLSYGYGMNTSSSTIDVGVIQDDAHWQQLLARLPDDLEQSVFTCGAILRRRQVRSAAQLLRFIFAYACNLPLSVVAGWAAAIGLVHITDQAIGQHIRDASTWLGTLLTQVLAARAGLEEAPQVRFHLVDGSGVTRPGARGTDWRLHLSFDLQYGRLTHVELTDAHTAESFERSAPQPGDVMVADRFFGTRTEVLVAVRAQANALVRIGWQAFPLLTRTGTPFDLFAALRTVPYGQTQEWAVQMKPLSRQDPVVLGRLVACRLPETEAALARARVCKQHRKTAKKNAHGQKAQLQTATLEAAEYMLLFTTLSAVTASTLQIVQLYRFRWQIELLIKRLKSIMALDYLTARHTQLCRAVLLAKLLLAVLVDDLCADAEAFSPSHRP